MSEEHEVPSWLRNARFKPEPKPDRMKTLNTPAVVEVLENAGLSIEVNGDSARVVDAILDPDEDWEMMKSWAEGRALTVAGRALRDRFVIEFLQDFNGLAAATRLGTANPSRLWSRLRNCPYTQRAIAFRLEKWEAEAVITKNKLMAALWREANDFVYGTPSSRVRATATLADILGLRQKDVNFNFNLGRDFVEGEITREEFQEMRLAFDEEF